MKFIVSRLPRQFEFWGFHVLTPTFVTKKKGRNCLPYFFSVCLANASPFFFSLGDNEPLPSSDLFLSSNFFDCLHSTPMPPSETFFPTTGEESDYVYVEEGASRDDYDDENGNSIFRKHPEHTLSCCYYWGCFDDDFLDMCYTGHFCHLDILCFGNRCWLDSGPCDC